MPAIAVLVKESLSWLIKVVTTHNTKKTISQFWLDYETPTLACFFALKVAPSQIQPKFKFYLFWTKIYRRKNI